MDKIVEKATGIQMKLKRFKLLKKSLKLRLHKTLVLPLILYPIVPLNACSKSQIERIQVLQNNSIRWIYREGWPRQRRLTLRHDQLKLEYISERIKRMAHNVWSKLEEENSEFFQQTIQIQMTMPHQSYPSSYARTFE